MNYTAPKSGAVTLFMFLDVRLMAEVEIPPHILLAVAFRKAAM